MTRPAARFAAGIAVVVTAMLGGCAPSRPPATIDLDQARLVSIIRNTASAEYESVWSGVPFVAQSNEVTVEVVDPTHVPLPPPPPPPTTEITIPPTTGPAEPPTTAPTLAPPPTPVPPPTTSREIAGGNVSTDRAIGTTPKAQAVGGGSSSSDRAIGSTASGNERGSRETESHVGSATRTAEAGTATVQAKSAERQSQAQIGGASIDAQRGGGVVESARGDLRRSSAAGQVAGTRKIGDVSISAIRPELTVRKHVDRARVLDGYVVTFALTIRNTGPLAVQVTEVRDRLSDDLLFKKASGARLVNDPRDPQLLRFRLDELLPTNAERVITITTRVHVQPTG